MLLVGVVISVVGCQHCAVFLRLQDSRACRCELPVHYICAPCAEGQPLDNLGDVLAELDLRATEPVPFGPHRGDAMRRSWVELQEEKWGHKISRECHQGHRRHGLNTKIYGPTPSHNGLQVKCLDCPTAERKKGYFGARARRAEKDAELALAELRVWADEELRRVGLR